MSAVHLVKLCVGADSVEDLAAWQAGRMAETGRPPAHVTRMWPRRAEEVLGGGSLYWVIRGEIRARQRIEALEPREGADGVTRCALVLDPEIVLTRPAARRPFQGWRYLRPEDAPPDLPGARAGEERLPEHIERALSEIGLV